MKAPHQHRLSSGLSALQKARPGVRDFAILHLLSRCLHNATLPLCSAELASVQQANVRRVAPANVPLPLAHGKIIYPNRGKTRSPGIISCQGTETVRHNAEPTKQPTRVEAHESAKTFPSAGNAPVWCCEAAPNKSTRTAPSTALR